MDRSFLRHAAVYGLATFLVQAGSFVLLPIYLRCLSPQEYGVLEVAGRLAETAGTLLLLGGFRQALYTFYQQAEGSERLRVVTATFMLVVGSCLVGGVATLALEPWLGPWLAADLTSWPLRLATLAVLLEPLSLLPLTLIQARVESGTYVIVVVAQFLCRVGLSILLVRFLHWGVAGALLAMVATGALFGLALSWRELSRGVAWPSGRQLRELVAFSLPLLPGGICFFILHHGDRFFLLHASSVAEVGTYALGYKLAMVVRVFSLVPLYMVWSSRMYEVAKTPTAAATFGKVFTRVLAAYLFAGLGLCLFAPEVVALLGGEAYSGAVPVVAPVVLACFFQSAATLVDAGLYVRHRTGVKLAVTAAATLVTLACYALLIPPWGAMGAALATLAGFAFLAAATHVVTQRIFYVEYEWGRLGGLCLLAGVLWLMGTWLPAGALGMAGKAALLAAAPVLAWLGGLTSAEEQAVLVQGLERLRGFWVVPLQERSA